MRAVEINTCRAQGHKSQLFFIPKQYYIISNPKMKPIKMIPIDPQITYLINRISY